MIKYNYYGTVTVVTYVIMLLITLQYETCQKLSLLVYETEGTISAYVVCQQALSNTLRILACRRNLRLRRAYSINSCIGGHVWNTILPAQ